MTIEKQKTFGPVVGMEPEVPVGTHASDMVVCSDNTEMLILDAFKDCRGNYHSTSDDRHDADVAIVTEILENVDKWVTEYTTENTDYADGYSHCVDERSHNWGDLFEDWIKENRDDYDDYDDYATIITKMVENADSDDCEPEYNRNEYASYSGDGCCVDSYAIGEYEEQIDINEFPELKALHDELRLDDILDDVNCDAYVSRSYRREKNEKTGHYENVGRETYMPYEHNANHPTFETYHTPGGRWDWVICADRMNELFEEAING